MISAVNAFIAEYGSLFLQGTGETLVMVFVSTAIAYLLGTPLGVLVTITAAGSLRPHRAVNTVLGWLVNIGRSVPFIILLVALIPVTKFIVGTSLGVAGATVPLVFAATPFVARMVEQSLTEVDAGLIEAAQSFGASTFQVVWKVLLPEALPSLLRGSVITLVTLLGYTAMAGAVGAGGLGDIAIRYGYYRYQYGVMLVTIVILVVLVQVIQSVGDVIARNVDHRRQRKNR